MRNTRFSVFFRKNITRFGIYFDISGWKTNLFYFCVKQKSASARLNKDEIRTAIVVFLSAEKSIDGEICHIRKTRQIVPCLQLTAQASQNRTDWLTHAFSDNR
jgi:hypothetical protein